MARWGHQWRSHRFRDFGDHKTAAIDVQGVVLVGAAERGGEVLAHEIPVQPGDRSTAHLQPFHHEPIGDNGRAGAGQTGEEDGQSLAMAGHIAALELGRHFGAGEPVGNLPPLGSFCHAGRFSKVTLLRYTGAGLSRDDPSDGRQFLMNQLIAATPHQSHDVWHIF